MQKGRNLVISTIRIIILIFLTISAYASNIDFDLYLTTPDQSKSIHVSNNEIIPLEGNLQIKVYSKEDGFIDIFYESQETPRDSILLNPIEIKAGQVITIPSEDKSFNLELSSGEVNFELAFKGETETFLKMTTVYAFDTENLINSSYRDQLDLSNKVSLDESSLYEIENFKNKYSTLIEINEKVSNIRGDLTLRGSSIYSKLAKGTVLVINYKNDQILGYGSGILIDSQHIITNHHVIYDTDELYVVPYGGPNIELKDKSMHYAKILKVSNEKDLALIKTIPISDDIGYLEFSDEGTIDVGMNTHAVGHPDIQETWTYARGYVNNLRKNYTAKYAEISLNANVIQNSTDVIPGFSGGPLSDEKGNVIGINSFIMPDGFQYAVTSNEVLNFLKKPNDFDGWDNSSSSENDIEIADDNSLEGYECFDQNKDGKSDYCGRDLNNNGYHEIIYVDHDYDGSYDEYREDENENEIDELVVAIGGSSKYPNTHDKYYYDLEDDGSGFDEVGHDYDGDMIVDEYHSI